ncbi:MAG: hypothetical protein MJ211_07765 [Bacteroidales bacterium]|nr:hypothetical protein [Bacteroidales bacterium]
MRKKHIILMMFLVFILQSCNINSIKRNADNKNISNNLNSFNENINNVDIIDSIDEYVDNIRQNGDLFDIKHKKTGNGDAVICSLKGNVVKVSFLSDSSNIGNSEFYIKESKPIFMNRNYIFDVDSSYIETAYYKDGKIFKCFCDGIEKNNIESKDLIADLSEILTTY